MALLTGPACKRSVNRRFEKLWIFGGMRLVAFHAVHHLRLDAEVGCPEALALGFVTRSTEGLKGLQKQRGFLGSMRFVTLLTIAENRRMDLFILHFCLQIFVTRKAEIRAFRQEELIEFCLVRRMTLGALVLREGLMPASCALENFADLLMTRKAKGTLFVRRHTLCVASMGIVAGEAIPFRKGRVGVHSRFVLHQIGMALGAQLRALENEKTLFL